MILIDSNVFMYAAGSPHEYKGASVAYLERVARNEVEAAVDTEALQEILHRYRALERWAEGKRVFDLVRRIVPTVLPIRPEVVDAARLIMDDYERLSARDALHVAVTRLHGIGEICSYDRDFDEVDGLDRIQP